MSRKKKAENKGQYGKVEKTIPLAKDKGGVKAGKSIQASALGLDTFGGGYNRNFTMNRAAYYTTYGNGDISSMQTINDVPQYFRMLNENNGGMFYWPITLKEKYDWFRYFCRTDPVVKRAVEFHTDLPMSRLILRMPKMDNPELREKIRKRYESMVKEIKLFDRLHSILFECNVLGNAFIFAEFDEKRKQWSKLIILPPEEVNIAQYPMSDNSRVEYHPIQLNEILKKTPPDVETEERYHESIKAMDKADRLILEGVPYIVAKELLENDGSLVMDTNPYNGEDGHKIGSFVYHFADKRHAYYDLGVSPLECIIEPFLMKLFYKNTQLTLSSRNMTPRNKISAVGITPDQLEDLREQIDQSMLNPDYSIVTNYDWSWEQIGANDRLIDLGREYEQINDEFFSGLSLTKDMVTGESLHSGSKINVELLNTRYMFKRELLIDYVENSLFEPMAEENGWYEEDSDGNKTYFYPKLSFTRLSIRDNEQVFDSLFQLYQKGSVPIDVILDLFNIDGDEIADKLKADMFTPKDPVYNDMIRGIYQGVADRVTEGTDIADQIIRSMTGPNGTPLKKVETMEGDGYMAGKEVPDGLENKEPLSFNVKTENSEQDLKDVPENPETKDGNDTVENKEEVKKEPPLNVKELEQ